MDTQKRNSEIQSNPDFVVPAQEEVAQTVEQQAGNVVPLEQASKETEQSVLAETGVASTESLTVEPDLSGEKAEQEPQKTESTLNDALVHHSAETSSEASYLNDIATGETPAEKLNSIL